MLFRAAAFVTNKRLDVIPDIIQAEIRLRDVTNKTNLLIGCRQVYTQSIPDLGVYSTPLFVHSVVASPYIEWLCCVVAPSGKQK